MASYLIRRLLLLPVTLFFIVLTNFVIINLAPGDPTTVTEISPEGGAKRSEEQSFAFGSDDRYLQFREHYGLTLPVLINRWPWTTPEQVKADLKQLIRGTESKEGNEELSVKEYEQLRIHVGDRSRFVMPTLLALAEDPSNKAELRQMAVRFFVRGGTRQAYLGSGLSGVQKAYNRKISRDNQTLRSLIIDSNDSEKQADAKIRDLRAWYEENAEYYTFEPTPGEKAGILFFETRFAKYIGRVVTLDFGSMRNDPNRLVTKEVTKRFKYSLTLALLPMLITFFLCQLFGLFMALKQNKWQDLSLNVVFLVLYATPVFVVAPFLIEKVALNNTFPLTDTPIPISGFNSAEEVFEGLTSMERLFDILQHIALPLVAIMYGSLAAQSRLSRTAVLEVLRQDYVRTARAKGLSPIVILVKHVGRNAGITIVTSVAGSLGVVLGGSLIIETIFGINGFGMFFYEAVLNRDYNVIMFSVLAGSFLALLGYLIADIAYTLLDPRVTLE